MAQRTRGADFDLTAGWAAGKTVEAAHHREAQFTVGEDAMVLSPELELDLPRA